MLIEVMDEETKEILAECYVEGRAILLTCNNCLLEKTLALAVSDEDFPMAVRKAVENFTEEHLSKCYNLPDNMIRKH
jgi:hypothetical protein